jgi:SAM-dependent methyltransferase
VNFSMARATGMHEHLDGPLPPAAHRATLDDLDRLNTWFGGYALTLSRLRRVLARLPRGRCVRIVDVGGGRGDLAVKIVRWARRRHRAVRVLVVDNDAGALAFARRRIAAYPEIALVRADAIALPLREHAADVAITALTLHHLDRAAAAACLAGMTRAAPVTVVNDLLRSRLTLALVWLTTRLLALHPVSRHDGPVSVRRAYSAGELKTLAATLGRRIDVSRYPWLGRLVAELR